MAETRSAQVVLTEVLQKRLTSYSLTQRERGIVLLLLQGLTNKEIAESCFITEQTVKDHLKHVFSKVGVHHRTALISTLLKIAPTRNPTQLSAHKKLA